MEKSGILQETATFHAILRLLSERFPPFHSVCVDYIAGSYNVGPGSEDCISNAELAQLFCESWGEEMRWKILPNAKFFPEARLLRLDCAKINGAFGWKPRWDIRKAVEKTVEWAKAHRDGGDIIRLMEGQINEYRLEGGDDA